MASFGRSFVFSVDIFDRKTLMNISPDLETKPRIVIVRPMEQFFNILVYFFSCGFVFDLLVEKMLVVAGPK